MEKSDNPLEQIRKQASSSQAEEVRQLLDQGKFTQAEALAREANLSPEDWDAVINGSDDEVRKISSEKLPEGPLSTDQAQRAVTGAENEKIFDFQKDFMPGMAELDEMESTVKESDEILDEILGLIEQAKSNTSKNRWAKPVGWLALPVISDIYGLIKGNKLRKQLKKLEKLNAKLNNPKLYDSALKEDRVSPNEGHRLRLTGAGVIGIGAVGAMASPTLLPAAAIVTVAGGITALIGNIKQVIELVDMGQTKKSLEDFEDKILEAKNRNVMSQQEITGYKFASIGASRENIEKMMN